MKNILRNSLIVAALLWGASSCDPAAAAQPIKAVETIKGTSGQSLDQFALSVRKRFAQLAYRSGSEVCGAIYQRDGVFAVDVVTTRNDMACSMVQPEDFTGHTIHTHPVESHGLFSEQDYRSGAGYLVTGRHLYHQAGKGTERKVSAL